MVLIKYIKSWERLVSLTRIKIKTELMIKVIWIVDSYILLSAPKTNLIKTFNNRGITLLVNPQQNLELLRVYKNELRRPEVIRPQGSLEDFISPDRFNRPIPRKSYTPTFKQSGA